MALALFRPGLQSAVTRCLAAGYSGPDRGALSWGWLVFSLEDCALRFVRGAILALLLDEMLAGCATHMVGPLNLAVSGDATFGASDPALAMAADGTRHYAWIECANGCRLIYTRMRMNIELNRLTFCPAVPR